MTTTINAIYEGGVLRPLTPLNLTDGERVEVTLSAPPSLPPDVALPRQYPRTPFEILSEIAAMSSDTGVPDTSSVDHDKVLYGEGGAR